MHRFDNLSADTKAELMVLAAELDAAESEEQIVELNVFARARALVPEDYIEDALWFVQFNADGIRTAREEAAWLSS